MRILQKPFGQTFKWCSFYPHSKRGRTWSEGFAPKNKQHYPLSARLHGWARRSHGGVTASVPQANPPESNQTTQKSKRAVRDADCSHQNLKKHGRNWTFPQTKAIHLAAALESLIGPEPGQQGAASANPGLDCEDRAPNWAFRLRILQSEASFHF